LFGSIDELPLHLPQLCLDVKKLAIELSGPKQPHLSRARHRAPAHARLTRNARKSPISLDPAASARGPVGHNDWEPIISNLAQNEIAIEAAAVLAISVLYSSRSVGQVVTVTVDRS